MGILDVRNVKKEFGSNVVLFDINFSINKNERVAIIGKNGSGKTTLLKLLTGELVKDAGTITFASSTSVGYLSQTLIEDVNNTLLNEMLTAFKEVVSLEQKLKKTLELLNENPEDKILLNEYGRLETRFLSLNGYDYHYLIDTILSRFGFSKDDYYRPIMSFSGGERSKIAFSKLLLNHPDILLLDEPTNHLDVSTIEWLEEYLSSYDGSIIVVSHDRYFIDNVCNRVFDLANGEINIYQGNYSYYLQEKVIRYEQQLLAYKLQQKEISHLEQLIARFKPKPSKVAFARSLETKLNRIKTNIIEKPNQGNKKLNFKMQSKNINKVQQLTIKDLKVGYDNEGLVKNIDFEVFNGDKIAIIGKNGIGKTTLLKTIYGELQIISGKIHKHRPLKIGYISQNLINIKSDKTIFDYFHDLFPLLDNTQIRTHLGSFLFKNDDVFKNIDTLSGGEKVRLAFAVLVRQKYDILLLDEPTNHLDMETKKILESAFKDFENTIIFISHDRYFVDELATKICAIDDDYSCVFYECDYQEYLSIAKEKLNPTTNSNAVTKNRVKTINKTKDDKKKILIEKKIIELETKICDNEQLLFKEEIYSDYEKLRSIEEEIKSLKDQLEKLELEYFELEEIE